MFQFSVLKRTNLGSMFLDVLRRFLASLRDLNNVGSMSDGVDCAATASAKGCEGRQGDGLAEVVCVEVSYYHARSM